MTNLYTEKKEEERNPKTIMITLKRFRRSIYVVRFFPFGYQVQYTKHL